jgi:predicted phage-related endonuclease
VDSSTHADLVAVIDRLPDDQVQEVRRTAGLGGSEIAPVLGLSPYATELDVYDRKCGGPQQERTEPMRWGQLLEGAIVARRAEDAVLVDRTVIRPQRIYRSRRCPDMTYSPDAFEVPLGLRFDLDAPTAGIVVDDAKTQSQWQRDEWDIEHPDSILGIPVYYWLQVQHGAYVLGAAEMAIDVLFGGVDYRRFECEPDPEVGEMLAETAKQFMDRVREGRPPAADPAHRNTSATLTRRHPGRAGEQRVLSVDCARALLDLAALTEQQRWIEDQVDVIRNRIREELGDATEGVCPFTGKVLVTWPAEKQGARSVSIADVRERYPSLYRGLERRIGRDVPRNARVNVRAKAVEALRASGRAVQPNESE